MAYLKVIGGPETGQARELTQPKSVLGRHPDCDIAVDHLDASRHHAQIVFVNNEPFVEDLHSRNGTFLNDERVRGRQRLYDNDRVRISESIFEFHQGESADSRGAATPVLVNDDEQESKLVVVAERDVSSSSISSGTSRSSAGVKAELRALLEITQKLRKTLSLDEVLPQILDSLFSIFPAAERGFILMQNEDGTMTPRWSKLRHGDPGGELYISRTIVDRVMQGQQAVLSADAMYDARFKNSDSLCASPIRSMMCAPLIDADGASFGVLQIDAANYRDRFREDDLGVLLGVATQASIAIENARLHEEALYQRSFERDLELADQIQRGFLPRGRPQLAGYEFFDYYQPATHVGGDFYDYFPLADGRLAVVVADVVGHGLAAAMLTAKLAAEVRYRLLTTPDPAEVLTQLNTSLPAGLGEYHFVTLVLGVLAPETGEVTIVNAGHMPPLLRLEGGRVSEVGKDISGFPLGIVEGVVYQRCSVQLPPRGLLVFYTDGINEAMNTAKKVYGVNRMLEQLKTAAGSPGQLAQSIIDDVRTFIQGCPQGDDMCLVCFGRE